MKEIKIKAIFGAHQIYQEIANYPPDGVKYLGISKQTSGGKYYENKKWKERINVLLQKFAIPRMILIKPGNYDLIHTSRGIIPLNKKPWVMDIEHVFSFTGLHPQVKDVKTTKLFVEKMLASKNCKAILCHCNATRISFLKHLNYKCFENKLKILYPSSHLTKLKKDKHKKIRILCVLSLFRHKAGLQVLESFTKLEKKYKNIELWMRSDVPEEIKKKYNSKNIIYSPYFGSIIPREELLRKVYSKCDIFLYPTFCDSFGYSLIDALVAGLPIISTNLFAVPEIVENKKNGFIIKIPGYDINSGIQEYLISKMSEKEIGNFVKDMTQKLEILIKNKKLREKMGKESLRLVAEGKFSLKERNKKLLEIYKLALK